MSKTVQIVMVPLHILAKEQRPKKCEFVILCHDLTFHDFKKPQTQFEDLTTFDQNTNVYMLAVGSNMQLLLSRQIVSKNLVAFRKKIQKQNNGLYAFTNVFDLFVQNQGSDY